MLAEAHTDCGCTSGLALDPPSGKWGQAPSMRSYSGELMRPWVRPSVPPFLSSSEEAQLAELLSPRPLGLLQAPPHGEARSPCSTSRSPERSQWSRWAQFPAPALHTHLGPPPGASWLDFSFLVPTPLLDPSVCFLNRHSTVELGLLSLPSLLEAARNPRRPSECRGLRRGRKH